jgi:hypothetical protein
VEVAQDCPSTTTFTLLDFNSHICRTAFPSLPKNLTLYQFDLLQDFQACPEWKNYYDLVSQRLMHLAFTQEQWEFVLESYFDILKPGGYLQLWEADTSTRQGWDWGPWAHVGFKHAEQLALMRNINHGIAPELPRLLKAQGFEIISVKMHNMNFNCVSTEPEPFPDAASYWYRNTMRGVCQKAYELGLMNGEDFQKFEHGIRDEWGTSDRGGWKYIGCVIVAQVRAVFIIIQSFRKADFCIQKPFS